MTPDTHFAENDGVSIAYQVFGEGPQDLVYIPGWLSNLDSFWEEPTVARFYRSLSKVARIILIDRRGTGLSDRVSPPTLEEQIDDVSAVMDAVGSEKAALLGNSEGGSMCILFAASHPERTSSLILVGSNAKWTRDDDNPMGADPNEVESWFSQVEKEWGGPISIDALTPSMSHDEVYRRWWAKFLRSSASKADAIALLRMTVDTDLRAVLPTIKVPTLVLQARDDQANAFERGIDLADRIPGSTFVEMNCCDHAPWGNCSEAIVREIQKFLGKKQEPQVYDRLLTTVLFTDIADSTRLAAEMGDARWTDLLHEHHRKVRHELEVYRGKEVKTTGDGFHATFDGPGRAIHCAVAIRESTRQLGLELRFGIHTGECEIRGDTLEGLAIHFAARLSGMAQAGNILVSRTVKDLVAGSGIEFDDFGVHALKGIPDEYQLFLVT